MQQADFSSTKSRIAQVIYVVGALIGLGVTIGMPVLQIVALVLGEYRSLGDFLFYFPIGLVAAPLFGLISYSTGWTIRWIIDGTSTSIFDQWIGRG